MQGESTVPMGRTRRAAQLTQGRLEPSLYWLQGAADGAGSYTPPPNGTSGGQEMDLPRGDERGS